MRPLNTTTRTMRERTHQQRADARFPRPCISFCHRQRILTSVPSGPRAARNTRRRGSPRDPLECSVNGRRDIKGRTKREKDAGDQKSTRTRELRMSSDVHGQGTGGATIALVDGLVSSCSWESVCTACSLSRSFSLELRSLCTLTCVGFASGLKLRDAVRTLHAP